MRSYLQRSAARTSSQQAQQGLSVREVVGALKQEAERLEGERASKAAEAQALERDKASLAVRVEEMQRRLDEKEAQAGFNRQVAHVDAITTEDGGSDSDGAVVGVHEQQSNKAST